MAQGTTKGVPIDVDPLLDLNSDLVVPSQKAIKAYVDAKKSAADSDYVNVAGDTMIGNLILNADPTINLGAATKQYVDNYINGLDYKTAAHVATVLPLPAYTVSGSGQILTGNVNGPIDTEIFDNHDPQVGERVLIKNETFNVNNGIYVLTRVGDASNPFILTRSNDANTISEIKEATLSIIYGETLANTIWHCTPVLPLSDIGNTQFNFIQVGSGSIGTGTENSLAYWNSSSSLGSIEPGENGNLLTSNGTTWTSAPFTGGVSNGDKGDITVSGGGSTWTIDNDAITTAKIANAQVTVAKISATGTPSASTFLAGNGTWATGTNNGVIASGTDRRLAIYQATATTIDDITSGAAPVSISINSATGVRNYTIPNVSTSTGTISASFIMSEGTQTIAGATSFTTGIVSTTSAQNTLGTALTIRNLYDNSQTRSYNNITWVATVTGPPVVPGYVELTLTASTTIPVGTVVTLSSTTGISGITAGTVYYIYGSSPSTTFRLATSYANALAGTGIGTGVSGTYGGTTATLALFSSPGTGTTLNFTSGAGTSPTNYIGSAIDSVLSSYGAINQPTFDLVFRTVSAGQTAAERVRINVTGTNITGTLSGASGGTLNTGPISISGGSTSLAALTIAASNHFRFTNTTFAINADGLPQFNFAGVASPGTKIVFANNNGSHSLIGISPAFGLAGSGAVGGAAAMWFSNIGTYLGAPSGYSNYHFYGYANDGNGRDADSGQGYGRGYPIFRFLSAQANANSAFYNEFVMAVSRSHYNNSYGTITSIVQNGSNIDITFTVASATVVPSLFEPVTVNPSVYTTPINPSNFLGISGRVIAVSGTTGLGDSYTVSIAGTLPSGTYVSGAILTGLRSISSIRLSFETSNTFGGASVTSFPYFPTIPVLSYEIGLSASTFGNRTGWHLFSHSGVTGTIHMASYATTINFATLQSSASTIDVGTANHTITVNGNVKLAGSGRTLGFFGLAGGTRATAYTQTYFTADKTHANSTYVSPGAYVGGANGYSTTTQAQAIITALGQLNADVVDLKQLVNSIIDDLQTYGLFQ